MAKERIERDDEDLVRLYLTDIGQYPLLTKDDEVRLAQAIEAGRDAEAEVAKAAKGITTAKKRELRRAVMEGEQAQQTFVQSNLRLVVSIAKKYQASGLPLLDLIQEGNLGLMHAVEKFDWRKGFKFSTYATWWIRQAITRGIANTGRTIRLPVHAGDTLARVQKAQARLELKLGRPATLAELGVEVEMPEDKLVEALRFRAEPLSLSEPLREDGDAELGQRGGPAQLQLEARLGLLHPGQRVTGVYGQPDGAPRVGDAPGDGLADPPGGVRGELETLAPVELLDGVHEAEVPLLDQVQQGQAGRLVLLGDRHDQPEVRLHERLLGLLAFHHGPPELALLGGRDPLGRLGDLGLGVPPGLDGLGEAYHVVLGQQWVLTDVCQVEPDEILVVALDSFLRQDGRLTFRPVASAGGPGGAVALVNGS